MSIREVIQQSSFDRYNSAVELSNERVKQARIDREHQEFQQLVHLGDQRLHDRAFQASGQVARLFDENPFTGFANIQTRPETGIKSYEGLTPEALSQMPVHKVRAAMANSNPHVSAAITDFQEYVRPGWSSNPESYPLLDVWQDNMVKNDNITLDGFIDQISESMFLHGAYVYESVFDENNLPQRLVSLDPYSMVFTRSKGPYGDFYELHQRQQQGLKSLHGDPTIEYRALYAQTGNPYGKCLVDSALFHLIMVVEFFKSYKQVLQTLVWPALLMRVDREVLAEDIKDPATRQQRVNEVLDLLREQLKKLGPGAVIAQGSEIMEPQILSGMNRANLGSVQDFIDILDRQIMIALKSNQLLFAKSDSFTETRAMYEMNHYALLINHAQSFINSSITRQVHVAGQMRNQVNQLFEFRLWRSIFEEERLLAGINKIIQDANLSLNNTIQSMVMWLREAVLDGRMTDEEANKFFKENLEIYKGQMLRREPF